MKSETVFQIAVKNLASNDSARFCLSEARRYQNEGNLNFAMVQALRSIAHSIGILHPEYKRAFKLSGIAGDCRLVSMSDAREK